MEKETITIYTDGACSPNPGKGGWGAVLLAPERGLRKELSGAEPDSTNNRMELMAAIEGLRALRKPCRVTVFTDSQYLRNAFEQYWIRSWQQKNWKTAAGKAVANQDLWKTLLELTRQHEVTWKWVKAHDGNPENERADALAVAARKSLSGAA